MHILTFKHFVQILLVGKDIIVKVKIVITVQSCLSRGQVWVDLLLTCVLHVHVLVNNPMLEIVN